MVRTYPFNPSTSSPNFSNLLVEDCEIRNNVVVPDTIVSLPSYKPRSAHFVGVSAPIARPYEQRSSPFISRTSSLPVTGVFPRVGWIHQQPPLRRQSYVEDNNHPAVNHLLTVPPNLHKSVPSLNEEISLPQDSAGVVPPVYHLFYQNNNLDIDERQYLEQQQQKIYSSEDVINPDISYQNLAMLSQQQPPSYGADYEKYLRAQEREQKAQYLRDLQQQAQQQKSRRLLTEVDYGGFEFEKDLLKDQQNRGRDGSSNNQELPPWLRGNPQPKDGFRGTNATTLQQPYNNNYNNTNIRREKSLPLDFTSYAPQSLNYNQPNGYNSTYNLGDTGANYNYKSELEKQVQERQMQKQREKLDQDRLNKIYEQQVWDPWGKGGAGAPIRDKDGKLVADRSKLAQSWNKMMDTNLPHNASPSASLNLSRRNDSLFPGQTLGTYSTPSFAPNYLNSAATMPSYGSGSGNPSFGNAPVSEKDFYKIELQKQIDERKRLRDLEKQKEKEEEMRERASFEKYAEKQRQELEAEKEKQRAKQEMAQRKFETMQTPGGGGGGGCENENSGAPPRGAAARKAPNQPRNPAPDDGLEWWERTPQNRNREESALKPSAAARPPPNGRSVQNSAAARKPPSAAKTSKPPSANPRGSRQQSAAPGFNKSSVNSRSSSIPPTPPPKASFQSSENLIGRQNGDGGSVVADVGGGNDSPPSRNKPIKPRSAAVKNEAILRQLSAMRERLNKEQIRVKSALRRKEYGDEVFSDEDGPTSEYLLKDELERFDANPAPSYTSNRRSSANKPPQSNRAKSSVRPTSNYDDLFDRRKNDKSAPDDFDEDPPLVKLIKNSRTSASHFARNPPNREPVKKSSSFNDNRRTAFSDDDTPTNLRKTNTSGRRPVISDDDSDPDAVVDQYLSKRTVGPKSQSQSLTRNPRPSSTDTLY